MSSNQEKMDSIIALCKRRGFIFQGSEIYGGLAGTWDYGPLGVMLKNNITSLWWKMFVEDRLDMYGIDAAILMNPKAWVASGHVAGFADPLVEDIKTKKRYRADNLLEDAGFDVKGLSISDMDKVIKEKKILSPEGNQLGDVRQFNMMLKTELGAIQDGSSVIYMRPETAGGMFVNYKNVIDAFHPKLPFGLAQIGKAFRNEIAPRDFLFRVREFDQMEVEYFVDPADWERAFDEWRQTVIRYTQELGLPKEMVHEIEIAPEDLAHYSKRTIDFEFDFPIGQKELCGLAYRTDFDLSAHSKESGTDLSYFDEDSKTRFIPHVIEPSLGVGRMLLAVLSSAYHEDDMGGEKRIVLKLDPKVAPIRCAVSPLLKNRAELVSKSKEVFALLKKEFGRVMYDDNGNIGKRYRRQDEIGTPHCVVIDFDTLGENKDLIDTVTVRDRDTGEQKRVEISKLVEYIKNN